MLSLLRCGVSLCDEYRVSSGNYLEFRVEKFEFRDEKINRVSSWENRVLKVWVSNWKCRVSMKKIWVLSWKIEYPEIFNSNLELFNSKLDFLNSKLQLFNSKLYNRRKETLYDATPPNWTVLNIFEFRQIPRCWSRYIVMTQAVCSRFTTPWQLFQTNKFTE